MSTMKAWKHQDDAYLREARERGDTFEAIGRHLGRTANACQNRYNRHHCRTPEQVRAIIRDRWPYSKPADIATHVAMPVAKVRAIAAELGLPDERKPVEAPAVPSRPRGYTAAEIAWAMENKRDTASPIKARDEAGLILLMAREAA